MGPDREPCDENNIEMNEPQEKPNKKLMNSTVLDAFTKLASPVQNVRVKSGLDLIKYLDTVEDENKKENEEIYALHRLIRGVGSSRINAKIGFYTVLVTLLNKSSFAINTVLEAIKEHLTTGKSISKSENGDILMGRLLVCGALIHSGMYFNATIEEQTQILEILLTAGNKRSYLSLAAYTFLIELIEKMDSEQFSNIWTTIKPEVAKPFNEHNLDTLNFVFVVRQKFPDIVKRSFCKQTLSVPDVLCKDSIQPLAEMLMNVTLVSTLKHPIYENIATQLVKKSLVTEFCSEINRQYLKFNRNRHLIITNIFNMILENLTDESVIPDLLTDNYIKNMLHCYKHTKTKDLRDEFFIKMDRFFQLLTTKLSSDGDDQIKLLVIKKFLFYPGIFIFEKIIKTKLIQHLTLSLSAEGVKDLTKLYKDVLLGVKPKIIGPDQTEPWINSDRIYAAQMIVKLLGHNSVQKEFDWKLEYFKFLLKLSLFKDAKGVVVGMEFASLLKNCFYHALDQKFPKLEDLRNLLSSLVHFINTNIFIKSIFELRTPLSETAIESWREMIKLLEKLEEEEDKLKQNYAIPIFHTLLLHMGLQLFSDVNTAESALQEIFSCYLRLEKDDKSSKLRIKENEIETTNEEPYWIEVVIDLFLNLLSKNSHLMRSVINCVFPYLCPKLTGTAIRQILDVLDPSASENPLINYEDDEEESDSSEDNDESEEELDTESDPEEEEDEESTATDKLRIAVREALHKTGYKTDDESEDIDEMDEEDGKKLDHALSQAFQQLKPRKKVNKNKQTKVDKTLTHFRVRVLDLIDMYTNSEPNMLQTFEIILVLLKTLEFSIRDAHQKPLEVRLRNCLKKLTNIKKFTDTDDINEQHLVDMLESILNRGTKSALLYQDIADIITSISVFIIRCSEMISSAKNQIEKLLENAMRTYFVKRDCMLPIALFKSTLKLNWAGNWSLVPLLFDNAFDPNIRPFRRSQALELLILFYNNSRFISTNEKVFRKRIAPVEQQLSNQTIELFRDVSADDKHNKIKEKFVCLLFTLLASIKLSSQSDNSNIAWSEIGTLIQNYRAQISLAKDAKKAFSKLCSVLKIQVQAKILQVNGNNKTENGNNLQPIINNKRQKQDKEDNKQRKKFKSSDKEKLKKETRLLRLEANSKGLETEIGYNHFKLLEMNTDE